MKKDRRVGEEASRWYNEWIDNGMLEKYLSGVVGDIGFDGYIDGVLPITEEAIGIDINYPNYDGIVLPFSDEHFDGILASHVLEHIPTTNVLAVIRDWHRVLKTGKYMVINVPDQYRYEKKEADRGPVPGSHFNLDHQRFYTPRYLMQEIEAALVPNSYRVELLRNNDKGFDYSIPPRSHSNGAYEIQLIIQKIPTPKWKLAPGKK